MLLETRKVHRRQNQTKHLETKNTIYKKFLVYHVSIGLDITITKHVRLRVVINVQVHLLIVAYDIKSDQIRH